MKEFLIHIHTGLRDLSNRMLGSKQAMSDTLRIAASISLLGVGAGIFIGLVVRIAMLVAGDCS